LSLVRLKPSYENEANAQAVPPRDNRSNTLKLLRCF